MAKITIKDLLEAGVHFGHQIKRWNPQMKDYVYGAKNGIYIIDLTKTMRLMSDACNFLQKLVMDGGDVLFVGTKRQAQQIVKDAAERSGMYYVSERWLGGTLTNNVTIRKSINKMKEIDSLLESGEASSMRKKEISSLRRQSLRIHKNLDGVSPMRGLPDVLVVVDVCHEDIAVKEARKLNIPVVALVDTNGNPSSVEYPIPANDDAVRSIQILLDLFANAIKVASDLYQKKEAERKAAEEAKKAEEKAAKEKAEKERKQKREEEERAKKDAKKKAEAAKKAEKKVDDKKATEPDKKKTGDKADDKGEKKTSVKAKAKSAKKDDDKKDEGKAVSETAKKSVDKDDEKDEGKKVKSAVDSKTEADGKKDAAKKKSASKASKSTTAKKSANKVEDASGKKKTAAKTSPQTGKKESEPKKSVGKAASKAEDDKKADKKAEKKSLSSKAGDDEKAGNGETAAAKKDAATK